MNSAQYFREVRLRLGLDHLQMSELTHVNMMHLIDVERGEVRASDRACRRASYFLNLPYRNFRYGTTEGSEDDN